MSSESLAREEITPELLVAESLERLAAYLRHAAALRPVPEADPLLTVSEAAEHLRRSPAFVREACRSGALVALRDGRGYRIRTSALTTYERRRTS